MCHQAPENVANETARFDGEREAREYWRIGKYLEEQFERMGFRMGELWQYQGGSGETRRRKGRGKNGH